MQRPARAPHARPAPPAPPARPLYHAAAGAAVALGLAAGCDTQRPKPTEPEAAFERSPAVAAAGVADGQYRLQAVQSGKCLSAPNANAGSQLQQRACADAPAQTFSLEQVAAGSATYYRLKSSAGALCADVAGGSSRDGGIIIQWTCAANPASKTNQLFALRPAAGADSGTYSLAAWSSGKCAQVSGGSAEDGAGLVQSTCDGGASQRFRLVKVGGGTGGGKLPAPPATIADSIRPGNPVVRRVFYDDTIAVYFGPGLNTNATWMIDHVKRSWVYIKKTYGSFGPDPRIYVVAHADKSFDYATVNTRFDAGFGYRNVIDLGGAWDWNKPQQVNYEVMTHELSHIIEGGSKDTRESPSFEFWRDGPWPEISVYDIYRGIGQNAWAEDWKGRMLKNTNGSYMTDVLPGQYYFFRDWFYPIYSQHGGNRVLNKYFTLLSQCFPKETFDAGGTPAKQYARRATFGEVVHFWSGAAGVNLKPQAAKAFGWTQRMEAEFKQAQATFACANNYPKTLPGNDGAAPTVSLKTSAASVSDPSVVTLTASAADNVGVTSVEFYDNGTKISELLEAPFVQPLTLVKADNGTHTYTVKAYDLAGNGKASNAVTVRVNITASDGGGSRPAPPNTVVDAISSSRPTVKRVYYDDEIAVYYANGMDPKVNWMVDPTRRLWQYTKRTFGSFGADPRIYVVVAPDANDGGTDMRVRYDDAFGYRNAIKLAGNWNYASPRQEYYDAIAREMSRIVEVGGKNVHESPTYAWWDVGPFAQIFTYDAYKAIGRGDWASAYLNQVRDDSFFKNWTYPLYSQYGGIKVFDRYFGLLAQCFPQNSTETNGRPTREYARRATPGEVLHFFSGAAGANLQDLYTKGFGWNAQVSGEFTQAQRTFACANNYPK